MRHSYATAIFVLLGTVAVPALLFAQDGKADQELMQIERDWCAASVKSDPAALGRILADDVSLIDQDALVTGKAEELARLKTRKTSACEVDMMKVRVFGDAAVVTGRSTISGVDDKTGPFTKDQFMWTDTFVRRDGRWQCVATQSTAIEK